MTSSSTSEITDGVAIQPFIILAKKTKGKASAALIGQTLNAPNVYVFGELLELPSIQQLAETEDKKALDLLKIFAYGTYQEYKANEKNLQPLTNSQIKKLQQLTIVSLAAQSKVIPYLVLQKELEISNLRELEDLIIDAIYQGIIAGTLDQKQQQIEVEYTMGRDLKPDSLNGMISVLRDWNKQAETLLTTIKEKIGTAEFIADSEKKRKQDYEKRIENLKTSIKMSMEQDMLTVDFDHGEMFGMRGNRPGKMKGAHKDSQRRGM